MTSVLGHYRDTQRTESRSSMFLGERESVVAQKAAYAGDSGTYSRFFTVPAKLGACYYCGATNADGSSADGPTPAIPSGTAPRRASSRRSSSPSDPALSAAIPSVEAGASIAPQPVEQPDGEDDGSSLELPTTSGTATGLWSEHESTTPPTRRSKQPATSPRSTSRSDPATIADQNGTSSGTTTTTADRWMCESCAALVIAESTPDGMSTGPRDYPEVPADRPEYPRWYLIPKSSRSDREPVLRGQLATERDQNGSPVRNARCAKCGRVQFAAQDARCQCAEPEWGPSSSARENAHPTVKPIDLMRHLVRLVTPPGGTVLDCFLGSGTTAIAAEMEGFAWIGIEKEAEYVAIAEARLNGVQKGMAL